MIRRHCSFLVGVFVLTLCGGCNTFGDYPEFTSADVDGNSVTPDAETPDAATADANTPDAGGPAALSLVDVTETRRWRSDLPVVGSAAFLDVAAGPTAQREPGWILLGTDADVAFKLGSTPVEGSDLSFIDLPAVQQNVEATVAFTTDIALLRNPSAPSEVFVSGLGSNAACNMMSMNPSGQIWSWHLVFDTDLGTEGPVTVTTGQNGCSDPAVSGANVGEIGMFADASDQLRFVGRVQDDRSVFSIARDEVGLGTPETRVEVGENASLNLGIARGGIIYATAPGRFRYWAGMPGSNDTGGVSNESSYVDFELEGASPDIFDLGARPTANPAPVLWAVLGSDREVVTQIMPCEVVVTEGAAADSVVTEVSCRELAPATPVGDLTRATHIESRGTFENVFAAIATGSGDDSEIHVAQLTDESSQAAHGLLAELPGREVVALAFDAYDLPQFAVAIVVAAVHHPAGSPDERTVSVWQVLLTP
jgi:hypothetical protein